MDEENFPDLSDLVKEKIMSRYIAASLTGFAQEKGLQFERAAAVACRLMDKVVNDYQSARSSFIEEENSVSISYGVEIINNLEDCLNAIRRIYRVLSDLNIEVDITSERFKTVDSIRGSIEHVNKLIDKGVSGPLVPWITKTNLSISLEGYTLAITDLAGELRRLHNEILGIFV